MVKHSENPEKSQKIYKIHFFFTFFLNFFFSPKKIRTKNAILLVFLYDDDSIRPELSKSSLFQISGGVPWVWHMEGRKSSCLILDVPQMTGPTEHFCF